MLFISMFILNAFAYKPCKIQNNTPYAFYVKYSGGDRGSGASHLSRGVSCCTQFGQGDKLQGKDDKTGKSFVAMCTAEKMWLVEESGSIYLSPTRP